MENDNESPAINDKQNLKPSNSSESQSDIQLGKRVVAVMGMHRCGTSATTGALQLLGVDLGKKLYAGHEGINPKGYFEHDAITSLNDEVLLALDSYWDDILIWPDGWGRRDELNIFKKQTINHIRKDFSQSVLWGIKDPRMCRLIPYWLDILSAEQVRPSFLFVIRPVDEVYNSLNCRDGFSQEKAFWLWVLHYIEAERATRGYPRCFLTFDNFLHNPAEELSRVEQQLGLHFPLSIDSAKDNLSQFLASDLKHHAASDKKTSEIPIFDLAYKLEECLVQATLRQATEPDHAIIDKIWSRLMEMQHEFPAMFVEQLRSANHHRGQTQLTLNRIMRSWSYFIGKPVRFLERQFGKNV